MGETSGQPVEPPADQAGRPPGQVPVQAAGQPGGRPDGQPAGQPGRYQRSTSGMVGALLVTLLVILGFVALRGFNRTTPDVKPEHVDYVAQVGYAQQAGATDLVYPASLPAGWYATQLTVDAGPPSQLDLSLLTADGAYAGLVQSAESGPALLARYVDANATGGQPVDVPGAVDGKVTSWDVWTDSGGDTALVARHRGTTLMVFGSATQAQLEQLASTLTTGPASR
jgi:hypothetical protein